MSSSDPSKALLMQHFLKDLTIMLSGTAFHAADTHRATSEGAARKGQLREMCRLEPWTNFFFRLRNRQKLVRIRFGCGLDSRIYGMLEMHKSSVNYLSTIYHNWNGSTATINSQLHLKKINSVLLTLSSAYRRMMTLTTAPNRCKRT